MTRRFIKLTDLQEILDVSQAQALALVRSGDLPAIKVGGRGQWRIETTELESYIERVYAATRAHIEQGDTGGVGYVNNWLFRLERGLSTESGSVVGWG